MSWLQQAGRDAAQGNMPNAMIRTGVLCIKVGPNPLLSKNVFSHFAVFLMFLLLSLPFFPIVSYLSGFSVRAPVSRHYVAVKSAGIYDVVPDELPLELSKDIYLVTLTEGSYPDPKDLTDLFFLLGFTVPTVRSQDSLTFVKISKRGESTFLPLLLLTYV